MWGPLLAHCYINGIYSGHCQKKWNTVTQKLLQTIRIISHSYEFPYFSEFVFREAFWPQASIQGSPRSWRSQPAWGNKRKCMIMVRQVRCLHNLLPRARLPVRPEWRAKLCRYYVTHKCQLEIVLQCGQWHFFRSERSNFWIWGLPAGRSRFYIQLKVSGVLFRKHTQIDLWVMGGSLRWCIYIHHDAHYRKQLFRMFGAELIRSSINRLINLWPAYTTFVVSTDSTQSYWYRNIARKGGTKQTRKQTRTRKPVKHAQRKESVTIGSKELEQVVRGQVASDHDWELLLYIPGPWGWTRSRFRGEWRSATYTRWLEVCDHLTEIKIFWG